MTQGNRLKQIRKENNDISQQKVASMIGVPQSKIAEVELGKTTLKPEFAKKLTDIFNKSFEWFMLGEGSPSKPICIPIPLYNIGAAAGAGTWLSEEPESECIYFDERWIKNVLKADPKNLHLIFTNGDSMDPTIKDKDLLMVDESKKLGNTGIFVILVNNTELRVKRVTKKLDGSLVIMSDNSKYQDEIIPANCDYVEIKIIGEVVWNGSKENI